MAAGADCAPYFDCAPGFYKRFGPTGTVDCEECQGALPALFGWISGGLSANDPTSCVMECQVPFHMDARYACKRAGKFDQFTNWSKGH